MDELLYQMIFKRKSFHLFKETGGITREELDGIREAFPACRPLVPEIKVEMKIVPAEQTTCKRGQEYDFASVSGLFRTILHAIPHPTRLCRPTFPPGEGFGSLNSN